MKFFRRRKTDQPAADCNPECSYRKGWRASTATMLIGAVGATITGVAYMATLIFLAPKLPPITEADVPGLCGWAGEEAAQASYQRLAKHFAKFQIRGVDHDHTKARAVLWDASVVVQGKHLATFRQEIGDCVGSGAKQAVDYLQCVEMVRTGETEFKAVYEPYHYACGRMAPDCGAGRIRGPDGSIGSDQAHALTLYGVLAGDLPGLEPYSAKVVKQWAVRMPEARWLQEGKKHLVRSAAPVRSADEVREAICNGYPITIASSWGGQMRPPAKDGRLVNHRVTTWQHQMCIIGYDGATGKEPYWYILNSWGEDAHGKPPDDAPPGGFWVTRKDVEFIVRQGDSFALSQFDGFPAQEWVILTSRDRPRTMPEAQAIVKRAIAARFNQVARVEDN